MTIVVKTSNPDNTNNPFSNLIADAPTGSTTLRVVDTTRINVDDYLIIGKEGTETSEVVKTTSITSPNEISVTALDNGHYSGEEIRVIRYNKVEVYRSDTQTGPQTLLATIDIQVENPLKETVYYDNLGDETKWYQIAFLNQVTVNRVYGDIFQGGTHEYASVQDFRMQTGFSQTDVSDEKVKWYLQEAYNHILHEGYVFIRGDLLNKMTTPTGETRFYFNYRYIADGDLNNLVDKNDLKVFEYDNFTETDITAQVASLNVLQGFITLNSGYPTSGKSVKAQYYIANRPLEELQFELKEASINSANWLVMREMGLNFTKKGVVSYSVDGISVSKTKSEFDKVMAEYERKYQYYIWIIKPMYVRGFKVGAYEAPTTISRFRGYY